MATNLKRYSVQEALNTALNDDGNALKVDLDNANITAGNIAVDLDHANDDVLVYGYDGSSNQKISVNSDGEVITTPGTASAVVKTDDGQIKASGGTVWSLQIDMAGVTIGDKIEIKNSTDNSGTALLTFTSTAANQSFTFTPSMGIAFSTGIYSDETKSGGTITVTAVYS
tara:strand:- start:8160 stop:8669 length:510 start_codon:yes stop_codon:yes gene_type:complete